MLTLNLMQNIELTPVPYGQILANSLFVAPTFGRPWAPTEIIIENAERIPRTGRVYLAMNHTDRYNYVPLMYEMWRSEPSSYAAVWVKGKYFNNPLMARFMMATNNIPAPSRGYLITCDAINTLGNSPSGDLYRILRDQLDAPERDLEAARDRARTAGVLADLERLLKTPRDLLGIGFNPRDESYFSAMDRLFAAMMEIFVQLNLRAFANDNKIVVFPEGTRSIKLIKGRPGLAQMALRTGATVVPIGCNGSEKLFPADSPISKGGRVIYRVGEPMTPTGELSPFAIEDAFTPFTHQAEDAHGEIFQAMTELLMQRIAELLDPHYLEADETAVEGANRFV